jgi:hypothetical protein
MKMKKIELTADDLRILLALVRNEQLGLESENPFEVCVTDPAKKDETLPRLTSLRHRLYAAL